MFRCVQRLLFFFFFIYLFLPASLPPKFPPPLYKSGINLPCTDSSISGTVPCSKLKDYRFLPSLLSIFVYNIFALDNITSLCRQYQTFSDFNLNKRWSVTDYFPFHQNFLSSSSPPPIRLQTHEVIGVGVCVSVCVCYRHLHP